MNQTRHVAARASLIVDPATLLASTMSAMRNPALYEDPDRFYIRRDHPRLHPVFGNGPHRAGNVTWHDRVRRYPPDHTDAGLHL
jgi:hypothetical protein